MRVERIALLTLAAAATAVEAGESIRIRSQFAPDQSLHYRWQLEATNTWTPEAAGLESGTMKTDFDFDLAAERMEARGCVFRVEGRSLESVARGKKGALGIRASPEEARLLLGERWLPPGRKTPLGERVTVTLGPRFDVAGSSGFQHLALYFLPSVDFRVWLALMTAPERALEPGQRWSQSFRVPVKELGDRPLDVSVDFEVDEATDERGRRTLVVQLGGTLALSDFEVDLKRGRTLRVASGSYSVTGRTDWDVARGIPLSIEAEQRIDAAVEDPRTTLEHRAWSRLEHLE